MEKKKKPPPRIGVQPAQVWRDSFVDEVRQAVLSGCTSNPKLAKYFGVCHATIGKWRKLRPEFNTAILHANKSLLAEVTNQMLISATEHQITDEKVLSDGTIVQFKKTLPGNVRAQETLARILGSGLMDDGDNSWDPKSKLEVSSLDTNPIAFVMKEISDDLEDKGVLSHKN
ncbi:hypothetical protein I3260_18705 [Photobacterium damselae]|uniref:hypothetical protein n=1 Tax=Gammaproteobacteria TaxID=1236 RepID=UPI001EDDEC50|nr:MULTISPECIES: hypothetical protein [Gammaproteobacteria]MCG3814268.1 hypothetical protein [Photobacterium damselae]MCG3880385.1 hypothetical protein [Psychrobacter sp. Ps6]